MSVMGADEMPKPDIAVADALVPCLTRNSCQYSSPVGSPAFDLVEFAAVGARLVYSMARTGMLPAWFGTCTPNTVPRQMPCTSSVDCP